MMFRRPVTEISPTILGSVLPSGKNVNGNAANVSLDLSKIDGNATSTT